MFEKIYYLFHRLLSKPDERGEYSGGYWQDMVRGKTLLLCRGLKGKVLEVGCGEGLFLVQLVRQNPDLGIWGIDNSDERLSQAKARLSEKNFASKNVNLARQEATALSFGDGYFDAVICINVIFNLESKDILKGLLFEMARVCKKRGKIIFDFRNRANPLLYFKYHLAPLYDGTVKGLPLKTYALEDMVAISNEAGLEVMDAAYLGSPIRRLAPIIILEAKKR